MATIATPVAALRGTMQTEAALRESGARFTALTRNLPGMVFQMQYHAGALALLYVSDGSYRVLHVAPEELVAQPSMLFDALVPADAARLRIALTEGAGTARFVEWEGALAGRPDEDVRWIELYARSRRQESGAVLWDGIISDITDARRAQEALRDLASHLTRAREEEWEAIARELHDDVGSTLTAVKFGLAWLKTAVAGDPKAIFAKLQEVEQLVDAVIESSTRMTQNLRPGILDEGLIASLEWQARAFAQRIGIPCSFFTMLDTVHLDHGAEAAMFRVCQEALNNIAKHAGATQVEIRLDGTNDALLLEIHDNGKGIAPADLAKRTSFGLRGMKERARALGGELDIRSDSKGGTTIAFSLFPDSAATGRRPRRNRL